MQFQHGTGGNSMFGVSGIRQANQDGSVDQVRPLIVEPFGEAGPDLRFVPCPLFAERRLGRGVPGQRGHPVEIGIVAAQVRSPARA